MPKHDERPFFARMFRPRAAAGTPTAAPTTEHGYSHGESFWTVPDEEKAPELRWPDNLDVYDSMRRQDGQVISVLRAVQLPIRRTTWRIDPAGASPEVVQFVASNLGLPVAGQDPEPLPRVGGRFSWSEHLHLALTSLVFGHSFFEQTYRIAPDANGVPRAWLRKLGWRPPKTISKIDVAADGGLIAIEQGGIGTGQHRMKVDRLVAYVNDREGGNWLGQSLLRPAYKYWLLKDRLLRVQAQTIDRNGMGVPVYTAPEIPKDIYEAEEYTRRQDGFVAAGLKIAQAFRSGRSSGASLPHSAEMKLLGVEGTLPDADKPIRYYDEQIARAVLAHFLNLGTETGSWALGSTFADFFTLSLQTVALSIADTATQHIVEDLVEINYGPDEPSPRITFDEIGSQQRITAEAIKSLVDAGVIRPDEDLEQFVRQLFALPVKAEGPEAGGVTDDAERARYAAETVQKVYLGVGPVIDKNEARAIVRAAGADLKEAT